MSTCWSHGAGAITLNRERVDCRNHKHTTDAHLLALAEKHGLHLATLDTGIPGAFVIFF